MSKTISESGNGYIESMGPEFIKACDTIGKSWTKWKKGPMTEEDIRPARRGVSSFITTKLV